jgi:hypothetical protein
MRRVVSLFCALLVVVSTGGCKEFFYYDWWFWGSDEHHPVPENPDLEDLLDHHLVKLVEELPSEHEGYRRFKITFTQRMDHHDAKSPMFEQHIVLHHRDPNAPVVLATTGYHNPDDSWEYLTEPAELLKANQIMVEHRYFPPSRPENADWTKLNIEQSAIDFHNIASFFHLIYRGKWISTGASKGGMTSVFHRRFFPNDVDATVGYVTPISLAAPDERYVPWLDSINPDGCGDDVKAFQERLIRDREVLGPRMLADFPQLAEVFTEEQAKLFSVQTGIGFRWPFWQYYGVQYCPLVELALTDDSWAARWLAANVQLGNAFAQDYSAYSFQAYTELGYQLISYEHLYDELFEVEWPEPDPNAPPPPPPAWGDTPTVHNPAIMEDVLDWVRSDAERILLIYGEYDPWSGGAIELGDAADSYKLVAPAATHAANIAQLGEVDRELALDKLFAWANVERPEEPAIAASTQSLMSADGVPTVDREVLISSLKATTPDLPVETR